MLGKSVSYYLSQYWRNVPLYAEKLIPLLDTCLSNNFVYSDKISGAFYELINKYQNTAELPLENLKEFIREQGYGYILDLMIQDEENIKMLWYMLVLIHQLKGSRDGLELVLSLFQESFDPDKISQLELLGEPTVDFTGNFLEGKGATLLTDKLNVSGACLNGSNGMIEYVLPNDKWISEEGTYYLTFTNASAESMGKINSMTISAYHANTDTTIIYENTSVPFTYPAKDTVIAFNIGPEDSPIKSIKFEFDCDFYNKRGACLSGIKVTKLGIPFLPIEGGTINSSGDFFEGYEADKAFQPFNIGNTTPVSAGSITYSYPNSLSAGTYLLDWSMLGSNDLVNYIGSFEIGVRYTDWNIKDPNAKDNTLSIYSEKNLPYIFNKKDFSVEFRADKPFDKVYLVYDLANKDKHSSSVGGKGIISDLGLFKKSSTVTIRTIPNMTSKATPSGSVITNANFAEGHDAFKAFNYTSPAGATPMVDGYVKYSYEENERPTIGDYTFTWANSSLDNNAFIKSMNAYVTYIDGTIQQISAQPELESVTGKTKYYFKFTALSTIKDLTLEYTCQYKDGVGGTFSEVNITKTQELESGSNIGVWHENLPVARENTFTIETEVDIAKTGSEFFDNFRNFVRHYVYPELQRLKVKYTLEGVQTQRIYSRSKVIYGSTLNSDF